MIKYLIALLTVIILTHLPAYTDETLACEPPPVYPHTYIPLTAEYFQRFINGEEEVSKLEIQYTLGISSSCPEAKGFRLSLVSKFDWDEDKFWIDMTYDELEYFAGLLYDTDQHFYYAGFLIEAEMLSFFQIIENNPEYFCDGEEYGGEESVDFIDPLELGMDFKCYIMIIIYPPDILYSDDPPRKAIIKGWDPCGNPPEELLPLKNFLDSVILPEMRLHPDD